MTLCLSNITIPIRSDLKCYEAIIILTIAIPPESLIKCVKDFEPVIQMKNDGSSGI